MAFADDLALALISTAAERSSDGLGAILLSTKRGIGSVVVFAADAVFTYVERRLVGFPDPPPCHN